MRSVHPKKLPILDNNYIESMKRAAPNTKRLLRKLERVVPPEEVASNLQLFKTQKCLYAERIDVVGGEPIAFDRMYIPLHLSRSVGDAILTRVDFLEIWLEGESLKISHTRSSVEAVAADQLSKKILNVPLRSPLLLTTDIVYVGGGTPVGLFETFYRGDRFKLISTNVHGGIYATSSHT